MSRPQDAIRETFKPNVTSRLGGRPAFSVQQLYSCMVLNTGCKKHWNWNEWVKWCWLATRYSGRFFFQSLPVSQWVSTQMPVSQSVGMWMWIGNCMLPRVLLAFWWMNLPRNLELRNGDRFSTALTTALQLASGDVHAGPQLLVARLQKIEYILRHTCGDTHTHTHYCTILEKKAVWISDHQAQSVAASPRHCLFLWGSLQARCIRQGQGHCSIYQRAKWGHPVSRKIQTGFAMHVHFASMNGNWKGQRTLS